MQVKQQQQPAAPGGTRSSRKLPAARRVPRSSSAARRLSGARAEATAAERAAAESVAVQAAVLGVRASLALDAVLRCYFSPSIVTWDDPRWFHPAQVTVAPSFRLRRATQHDIGGDTSKCLVQV